MSASSLTVYVCLSPALSCPQNSHYTTCVPACSPTCLYLNGPPRCSDNEGCVPGCVCDDGFVLQRQVCVPLQQCGCVDRKGTKHQVRQFDNFETISECLTIIIAIKKTTYGQSDCRFCLFSSMKSGTLIIAVSNVNVRRMME